YQYEPLNTAKKQIRLLRLQSSGPSSDPHCEISIFDLSALPPYIALSYAWDEDSKPKSTVMLDNKKCSAGQTLCAFFFHFQEICGKGDHPWIWIDQLCIDQENVQEKNHQIPLMSTIYSQCSHVIA
ncbi:HET-domain-containing protein, partial [Decorospora gaudefroyi]